MTVVASCDSFGLWATDALWNSLRVHVKTEPNHCELNAVIAPLVCWIRGTLPNKTKITDLDSYQH